MTSAAQASSTRSALCSSSRITAAVRSACGPRSASAAALDAYLADRARRGGLSDTRQLAGPLLATAGGGRLRQGHLWDLVRRLARDAGIQAWDQLSPLCLRHSAITFALDAGAALRDVQDYAGHKDPRTTRAGTTMPGTAWTATPPTRSRPTSPDRNPFPAALRGPATTLTA